jgi:hypothetical protein
MVEPFGFFYKKTILFFQVSFASADPVIRATLAKM